MSSVPVRVPEKTYEELQQIAAERNETIGRVIVDLVEVHKREQFWTAYEQAAIRARNNPDVWQGLQDEQAIFDGTLRDGLE